jgi:hypothetical protein
MIAKMNFSVHSLSSRASLQVLLNCANHIVLLATSKNSLAFTMASMPTVAFCHLVTNQQQLFIPRVPRFVLRLNKL